MPNPDALGVPDAILLRPTVMVVFDAVRDEVSLVTPVRPQAGRLGEGGLRERAGAHRRGRLRRSSGPCPSRTDADASAIVFEPPVSNTTPGRISSPWSSGRRSISAPATSFRSCCRSASRRRFPLPAFALYRSLRRVNPAPFLCYLDFEDFQIVCSSPEILVRVRDGKVTIRPIAGTRPRGATAGGGPRARRKPARRSEGARRAPDAARSRPQRRRPGRRPWAPSRSPTASSSNTTAR